MKTLLALGCSFTDKDFHSTVHPEMDCSWPKWPEIVGEKLGYNVVNLGECGNSNDRVFKAAQDYLIENNVDIICALWTSPSRLNLHDSYKVNWNTISARSSMFRAADDATKKLWLLEQTKAKRFVDIEYLHSQLFQSVNRGGYLNLPNEYLRNMYMLEQLGKSHNVPVYHAHGTNMPDIYHMSQWYKENDAVTWHINSKAFEDLRALRRINRAKASKQQQNYLKAYIECKYFSILDRQSNIYGWPFYKELGGFTVSNQLNIIEGALISDVDPHPNANGQRIIASTYLEMIA
jgi:hypothetical protein